jgi:hypothetical protein
MFPQANSLQTPEHQQGLYRQFGNRILESPTGLKARGGTQKFERSAAGQCCKQLPAAPTMLRAGLPGA